MNAFIRKEVIGDCVLYQGDCLEVMCQLGQWAASGDREYIADAVVTDPPYGIGVDRDMAAKSGQAQNKHNIPKSTFEAKGWDDEPIGEAHLEAMARAARHQIVFGGNYFPVPPSRCWLVWDKKANGSFADCELAWTNLDKPVRYLEWMWNGMLRKGKEERHGHPTQKPVGVMEWCINHLPDGTDTILDPFMGSGTTLVACAKLGRKGIGIELDQDYFDIACERVREAYRQPDLFIEQPKTQAPTQEGFDI